MPAGTQALTAFIPYPSAFGNKVPVDVWLRSNRLALRFNRPNYLNEWLEYQYKKACRGEDAVKAY